MYVHLLFFIFFFFNDTATTEIYTLSLHDALPIWRQTDSRKLLRSMASACSFWCSSSRPLRQVIISENTVPPISSGNQDRKSTRLNSSHSQISYAVFCLKKKKKNKTKVAITIKY